MYIYFWMYAYITINTHSRKFESSVNSNLNHVIDHEVNLQLQGQRPHMDLPLLVTTSTGATA